MTAGNWFKYAERKKMKYVPKEKHHLVNDGAREIP